MGKTKILYVITQFDLGGAQHSLLSLLSILSKDKYEIFLSCAKTGILLDDVLHVPDIKVKLFSSLRREINPLYDLKALIDLYYVIKNNRIDIVHTHSSKAGILGRWAAKLAGVPVIIHTVHGWEFYRGQNPILRSFYVFLERMTAGITDKFIAVSDYDIEEGLRERIGARQKYALVRYGIRRGDFSAADKAGASAAVGMIACFKPQKSPQDLIRAAALVTQQFPSVKFMLAGDGVLRNEIERLINELNLTRNVILLGWRRDIAQLLSLFDILVLTSRWEGLPIVFLEAMAAGKPVIATSVCGNSEIIKDGKNGFLVPPGDYKALSEKIALLLKDKKLRENMGRQGFEMLNEPFEVSHMVNWIEQVYNAVCRKEAG